MSTEPQVSAKTILDEYRTNVFAADQRYLDKVLIVAADNITIGRADDGRPFLRLSLHGHIHADFPKSAIPRIARLTESDMKNCKLLVRGKLCSSSYNSIGVLTMSDCTILE